MNIPAKKFREKYSRSELVNFTTSDGMEWVMKKPNAKFFFDMFVKKDISLANIQIDTEMTTADINATMDEAKKITPIYDLIIESLVKYSHSPKILATQEEVEAEEKKGNEDVICIDELPSFEYMGEMLNGLIRAAGVPSNETAEHSSFRQ